jgi:low affinity Fe/Cu permease
MPTPERPTQIRHERAVFDRFAESSSRIVGRAAFFTGAVFIVVLWLPLIAVFESIDTWQLVLNTVTSVVAFLLIALLQNSERRNDRALHRKLDTLALALVAQMRHQRDSSPELESSIAELEAAVKLEEQI